jgi:hypothetical protein
MDRDTEASAALALARANRVTEAEHLAAHVGQQFPLSTSMNSRYLPSIRAAIELSRNNPSGAVTALQPATRNAGTDLGYPTYLRGLAYLQLAEPLKAQTEFQKIIDHQGIVLNFIIGALAHLQLARAQAMAGDKEAARKPYQGLSHSLERCRSRHSHLPAGQGGVRKAEVAASWEGRHTRERLSRVSLLITGPLVAYLHRTKCSALHSLVHSGQKPACGLLLPEVGHL